MPGTELRPQVGSTMTDPISRNLYFSLSARANPDVEQVAKMLDDISLLNAG